MNDDVLCDDAATRAVLYTRCLYLVETRFVAGAYKRAVPFDLLPDNRQAVFPELPPAQVDPESRGQLCCPASPVEASRLT